MTIMMQCDRTIVGGLRHLRRKRRRAATPVDIRQCTDISRRVYRSAETHNYRSGTWVIFLGFYGDGDLYVQELDQIEDVE